MKKKFLEKITSFDMEQQKIVACNLCLKQGVL